MLLILTSFSRGLLILYSLHFGLLYFILRWIYLIFFYLFCRLRDEEEFELDPDHFEGGTIEQTTLLIKNSTRHDIGAYTCMLGNEVGISQSHNSVEVSVYCKFFLLIFSCRLKSFY